MPWVKSNSTHKYKILQTSRPKYSYASVTNLKTGAIVSTHVYTSIYTQTMSFTTIIDIINAYLTEANKALVYSEEMAEKNIKKSIDDTKSKDTSFQDFCSNEIKKTTQLLEMQKRKKIIEHWKANPIELKNNTTDAVKSTNIYKLDNCETLTVHNDHNDHYDEVMILDEEIFSSEDVDDITKVCGKVILNI